jgi:endonuclease/exonuclease/phosphatase (EEP) superfamily protein YafD
MITVDAAKIAAVLVGGEWFTVTAVSIDQAEYAAPAQRYARGLHLRATLQQGPHSGDRLVAPLFRVEAIRLRL